MKGSIKKRGTTYSIRVDAGTDANGKRKQIRRSGFKTKKAAQEKINELLYDLQSGKQLFKEDITIQELFAKYDRIILSQSNTRTMEAYREGYKRFMKYLKQDTLTHIKPYHLQEAYSEMLDEYSIHSHNNSVTIISHLFEFAVDNEFIQKDPHKKIKMKKVPKTEIDVWTEEDINKFMNICHDDLYSRTMFALTLHTGMRKGEVRGLMWDDIDLSEKVIHIKRQLAPAKSQFNEWIPPKSESSRRPIYISNYLVNLLKKYKKHAWHPNISNGVFSNERGTAIATKTMSDRLDRYAFCAGIKRIRYHDLRHTHATILIQKGVNIKVVSDRLGHSDISITLNKYTHFDESSKREAAEVFESVTVS
ncbi:site-specific integrase [Halobacillus ihumii]|uniref:site-specific integrase n=1 Tax=Halobacillus ihumii TaxID=2686092 RepID=UPI0013D3A2AD|nr:site-specific integrase [Halobacillus ihumii]